MITITFINILLLCSFMNIDQMAADWDTNLKPKKGNDWNWFFSDTDHDGVMNGVDCKPYNKKRQDGFISLQSQNPFQAAVNKFKAPQGAITSGPDQNVSIPPKQNVEVILPKYSYTDTNKPYVTSGGNVYTPNNVQVNPIFKSYNPITKTGGGLKDYYRGDLNPAAGDAIKKGYDVKAIENMYDTHPLYPIQNAQSIAAGAAQTYLQNKRVKVIDVNRSSVVPGMAGEYDGRNIKMYKEATPDYNGLLIHETVHAIQRGNPITPSVTKEIYNTVYKPALVKNAEPNITGNNINGEYISSYTSRPIYKNINNNAKQREAEAYYIQNYYSMKEPRNKLVDDFERKLDINTARTLTPDQQQIYNNARDTLVRQAQDRNDMTTGIFQPIKKQSGIFRMTL